MGGALCYRFDMTVESIQIDSDNPTDMAIFMKFKGGTA